MIRPARAAAEARLARLHPNLHDAPTFALACRCLSHTDQLSEHEISFIRAMAAIALSESPSPEQSARLMDIARRVGAEP
jgi:hypothetical protein